MTKILRQILESVETDLRRSIDLADEADKIIDTFASQIENPSWNPDTFDNKFEGQDVYAFYGRHFDLIPAFKDLLIVLRPAGTKPLASFSQFKTRSDTILKVMALSVVPEDNDMYAAMQRVVDYDMWRGAIIHELQHVYQSIQNIPFNTRSSFNRHGEKIGTAADYYNEPTEFDAHYYQHTREYHDALTKLRASPNEGIAKLQELGFVRDFKDAMKNMLPMEYDDEAFGIWFYAEDKQRKRLIKRLYALHSTIVKELDTMDQNNDHRTESRVYEADDAAQHQKALDDKTYWGNAGAGCIIMAADTKRILLPLRSEWVQEPHTWSTWGGAIDPGEDPERACMREVEEEAGYAGRVTEMVHLYTYTDDDFRYDTFVAVVPSEFSPELNWETERAEWVKFGQWPNPLHFGLQEVLKNSTARNKLASMAS